MRPLFGLLLLCGALAPAQTPVRVALTNSNIASGVIVKDMKDRCGNIILTNDDSKAAYRIEAQFGKESAVLEPRTWLTVFDKTGDAVYATEAMGTPNAVKDVCEFLGVKKR